MREWGYTKEYRYWMWSLDGETCFPLDKVEKFILKQRETDRNNYWDVFAKVGLIELCVNSCNSKEEAQRWLRDTIGEKK